MRRPLNGVQQVWSHLARFCWTVFTSVTRSEQSREPHGLTVQFTAMLLPCLGLPGWIALKGCPAGLPSRLDSFTASLRSQILHVRAGFPPWGRPPATRQRQTSHAEQAPCHRPHSPVAVPTLLRLRRFLAIFIFPCRHFPRSFWEEEEEEAVFISLVNTNEDPPNAHQAQHRPVQATGAMSA